MEHFFNGLLGDTSGGPFDPPTLPPIPPLELPENIQIIVGDVSPHPLGPWHADVGDLIPRPEEQYDVKKTGTKLLRTLGQPLIDEIKEDALNDIKRILNGGPVAPPPDIDVIHTPPGGIELDPIIRKKLKVRGGPGGISGGLEVEFEY